MERDTAIEQARHFNRFYTRALGLLDESLAGSGLNLSEARILYEIAQGEVAPGALAEVTRVDPGYVSRILAKFTEKRLVLRKSDPADGRRRRYRLSGTGAQLFARLESATRAHVGKMLASVPDAGLAGLQAAMRDIERKLQPATTPPPFALRPLQTGDLGWIAHRQALLYAQEYGWSNAYEALVSRILGDFVINFREGREQAWVAEAAGTIVGSVFLVQESETAARLRLLYVEPHMRGSGLGRALIKACTGFARAAGYAEIVLWTQSNLSAARHLYASEGYRLIKSEPHFSFGAHLVGETWTLDLKA